METTTDQRFQKTAAGEISAYALLCGYQQTFERNEHRVRLYADACYHVQGFLNGYRFWESFYSLKTARKCYRKYQSRIVLCGMVQ